MNSSNPFCSLSHEKVPTLFIPYKWCVIQNKRWPCTFLSWKSLCTGVCACVCACVNARVCEWTSQYKKSNTYTCIISTGVSRSLGSLRDRTQVGIPLLKKQLTNTKTPVERGTSAVTYPFCVSRMRKYLPLCITNHHLKGVKGVVVFTWEKHEKG